METGLGFGDTLVSEVGNDPAFMHDLRAARADVLARVDAVLRDEFRQAHDTISNNRNALDDLVEAVVEHKVLRGEIAVEIVETAHHRRLAGRGKTKRAKRG
jgi:hypothetical protein